MKLRPILAAAIIICASTIGKVFAESAKLEFIKVSPDKKKFILAESGKGWAAWGVNYDHDGLTDKLLEDFWYDNWAKVVKDVNYMKNGLRANLIRIHLQTNKFMDSPTEPNKPALRQLVKLMYLAEEKGIYLDLTGLCCYDRQLAPIWYKNMTEPQRWAVHVKFWEAIAQTCQGRSVVFCYNLMNEPVIAGEDKDGDIWMADKGLGGKTYVQRIALDLAGRNPKDIAQAWIDTLVKAIRKYDSKHMITVGTIPWALTWPGAKPVIEACDNLDFVSVHFYPKANKIDNALEALKLYDLGKPLVIEEIYPMDCSDDELDSFIDESRPIVDGYVSFYWGLTIEDTIKLKNSNAFGNFIPDKWFKYFRDKSAQMVIPYDPNAVVK